MKLLNLLMPYMGNRRWMLPLSLLLSALSAVAGLAPFVLIWAIVKALLAADGTFVPPQVAVYAWWASGLAVAGVAAYFGALMCSHLVAFRVESNLRQEAMRRVVEKPLGFFDRHTSGLIRKVIDDNASITHSFLAHQLPDLAGTLLTPLVTVGLICWFNWQLGLVCIAPFLMALALMGYMMGSKGREFMKLYMTHLEEMNAEAVEYVRGIPVVKVFQQTIYSFKNFHRSIMDYNRMACRYVLMWEKPMSAYTVIINGFVFFLAPVTVLLLANGGDYIAVITDFFLFVLVTPVFSGFIMKSMYLGQAFGQTGEAVERMEKMLHEDDGLQPEAVAVTEVPADGSIVFKQVTFSYPGASCPAVDGVSFEALPGQTVALVGASGSGKTSIARLVPRFWTAQEGEVKVGGVDVRRLSAWELMARVSFVFQHTRLFKGTLRENLLYGRPDATPEEVHEVLERMRCLDIVQRLPRGLDTRIGSGADGTYLSGGEQQRIVLARAMLKNAPIVVLDEATAFADPENEYLIRMALNELTRGKTVLMIAHRLTTVTRADLILVMNHGRIAERGTHDALLAQGGLYKRMWEEYGRSVRWTLGAADRNAIL